jgi:hypothetical protein
MAEHWATMDKEKDLALILKSKPFLTEYDRIKAYGKDQPEQTDYCNSMIKLLAGKSS